MCDMRLVMPPSRQIVVVALDRSASILPSAADAAEAFVRQLRQSAEANGDEIVVLPFAAQPKVAQALVLAEPEPAGESDLAPGTNLAAAIQAARAMVPADRSGQIVLLTDGNQTEGDALAAACAAGMPVSTVPLESSAEAEVYVSGLLLPPQARQGDPLEIEVIVESSRANEGSVELYRGPIRAACQRVRTAKGSNHVRFRQSAAQAGAIKFTAKLSGFRDTLPANNAASAMLFVADRPRVLLAANASLVGRHLAAALEAEAIQVESCLPGQMPKTPEALDSYELVVLANVPAEALAQQAMEALRAYVRDAGGGLLVIGGDQAFTPGGYRNTVLEEILPVRCEFQPKQPRGSLAMVLILDRSDSMRGPPIALAKEAVRRAVNMLDPADQVGVLAFDDTSQWIVPIGPCTDKVRVLQQIDTIQAVSRTVMYPAMEKAFRALDEAFAEFKYMIILTDGISDPGDFDGLARRIAQSGITISTVGVGRQIARPLLEDIARIGKGHNYFCEDMADVPKIFALETASATRLGIVEQPVFVQRTGGGATLGGLDIKSAPSLLGYVGTRPKPASHIVLASEAGDPLLAWWRYGRGISVAFTSDVESRWAAAWLSWPGFGRFWAKLARHAMRKADSGDCQLDVAVCGSHATVTLEALDSRGRWLNAAEAVLTVVDPKQASRRFPLPQVAPGRYSGSIPTPSLGIYCFEASLSHRGRRVYAERGALSLDYPDEFRIRPPNGELLQRIAQATGGTYRASAESLFGQHARSVPQHRDLRRYLLAVCAGVFVIDLALRRLVRHGASSPPA